MTKKDYKFFNGQIILYKVKDVDGVETEHLWKMVDVDYSWREYKVQNVFNSTLYIEKDRVKPFKDMELKEDDIRKGDKLTIKDSNVVAYVELVNDDKVYMTRWGETKTNELIIYPMATFKQLAVKWEWQWNDKKYVMKMDKVVETLRKGGVFIDGVNDQEARIDWEWLKKGDIITINEWSGQHYEVFLKTNKGVFLYQTGASGETDEKINIQGSVSVMYVTKKKLATIATRYGVTIKDTTWVFDVLDRFGIATEGDLGDRVRPGDSVF